MVTTTLFACIVVTYILFVFSGALAEIQLEPLDRSSGHTFKEELFERLNRVPSWNICVWSRQAEAGELLSELSMSLSSGGKSVTSLRSGGADLFREECLHSLVLLQNFTRCGQLWKTLRSISILHHVYVVVDTTVDIGEETLTSCSSVFGHARVLFVFLRDERVLSLSNPQFPPRHLSSAQLGDILSPVKLVFQNMNRREIKVATFNCTPYVVFYQDYDPEFMDGVEGRVLKELSSALNFKIDLLEMSEETYGLRINNTWMGGGMMGALNYSTAEIGLCNIWCDVSNTPVLEFGPFNNLVSYGFLVPRPQLLRGNWKNLTGTFQLNVWLAAVCSYCACSFCYWMLCNLAAPEDGVDAAESLLTVFGMLTLTSWHTRSAARQLVSWWLLFVLLLTATYSSGIAARLTRPRYEPRVDTIQQLVDHNFHWYSNNITENLKTFLLNMGRDLEREWGGRYRFLPPDRTGAAVRSRHYALLVQRLGSTMIILNVHGLDYHRDLKDMRVQKSKIIDNVFTCFGFTKRSPLIHTLQNALLQLRQMGLVDHWTRAAVKDLTPPYMMELLQEHDGDVHVVLRPLTKHNLMPAFYILLGGLCLSSLLFSLEVLCRRYILSNRNEEGNPISPFVN